MLPQGSYNVNVKENQTPSTNHTTLQPITPIVAARTTKPTDPRAPSTQNYVDYTHSNPAPAAEHFRPPVTSRQADSTPPAERQPVNCQPDSTRDVDFPAANRHETPSLPNVKNPTKSLHTAGFRTATFENPKANLPCMETSLKPEPIQMLTKGVVAPRPPAQAVSVQLETEPLEVMTTTS